MVFGILMAALTVSAKTVNPRSYGIGKAKTSVERYEILLRCHQDAINHGYNISYRGIKQLTIEIPKNAQSIPLPRETDFAGVKIYVRNCERNHFLFSLEQNTKPVKVDKNDLKAGKTIHSFAKNDTGLLIVKDTTPWVKERKGFNHAVYRKDIFLIEKGALSNDPIYSYGGKQSTPEAKYTVVSFEGYKIKGANLYRANDSSFKTYFLSVDNMYNVEISDIAIYTPNDDVKYGDEAIRICNSINVRLNRIRIEGTYSQVNSYGYGVSINNVRDLQISNFTAKSKWGVFYTSNICNVTLDECSVNRFDLHCYGRDITIKNSSFKGRPLPYSSLYGTLLYDHCTITDGDALNLRQDYNANTPFNVIWKNCVFNLSPSSNCIIRVGGLTEDTNSRDELSKKCLPNIKLKDCTINTNPDMSRWFFIITGRIEYKLPIEHFESIIIDGLTVNASKDVPYNISSGSMETKKTLNIEVKNSRLIINNKGMDFDFSNSNIGKSAHVVVDNQEVKVKGPSWGTIIINKLKDILR